MFHRSIISSSPCLAPARAPRPVGPALPDRGTLVCCSLNGSGPLHDSPLVVVYHIQVDRQLQGPPLFDTTMTINQHSAHSPRVAITVQESRTRANLLLLLAPLLA